MTSRFFLHSLSTIYHASSDHSIESCTCSLELGGPAGLEEALLGLLEVDDVPDGVEVLHSADRHAIKSALVFTAAGRGKEKNARQP